MLLSDAIRKGCEVTEKGPGATRSAILKTRTACVLGAALLTTHRTYFRQLYREWPCLKEMLPPSVVPEAWRRYHAGPADGPPRRLIDFIVYANDATPASREAIAEWVERLHEAGIIDARHRGEIEAVWYVDAGLAGLAPLPPDPELPSLLLPTAASGR